MLPTTLKCSWVLELNLLKNTVRASPGICTIANANFADNVASSARNKKLQSLQGRSVKLRERFMSNEFFCVLS